MPCTSEGDATFLANLTEMKTAIPTFETLKRIAQWSCHSACGLEAVIEAWAIIYWAEAMHVASRSRTAQGWPHEYSRRSSISWRARMGLPTSSHISARLS